MNFTRARDYTGAAAWDALDIAEIEGASVRLHWTDRPYEWHVNHGEEVFVVLDGAVDMHWRDAAGDEHQRRMSAGDLCHAGVGDAHVAHPVGPARILVIERKGSV